MLVLIRLLRSSILNPFSATFHSGRACWHFELAIDNRHSYIIKLETCDTHTNTYTRKRKGNTKREKKPTTTNAATAEKYWFIDMFVEFQSTSFINEFVKYGILYNEPMTLITKFMLASKSCYHFIGTLKWLFSAFNIRLLEPLFGIYCLVQCGTMAFLFICISCCFCC